MSCAYGGSRCDAGSRGNNFSPVGQRGAIGCAKPVRHPSVDCMALRIADFLMVPMPDQLAILIDFPDAMERNLAYCAVGAGELEEKVVAGGKLDVL